MNSHGKRRGSERGDLEKMARAANSKKAQHLDESTNQRLNNLYHKFLSRHRQSPAQLRKQTSFGSNSNHKSDQSPMVLPDEDGFLSKCQISIDKDLSIERMKTGLEEVIENALDSYDSATAQYLKFIFEKFSNEARRLSDIERGTAEIQSRLLTSRLRRDQSLILKQTNKELQHKIISLQSQIGNLKASKELSGLRSTLQKARQNNSVRERNPTPGRDCRFEIEKKILMKQNLELKKQIQSVKSDYELRLQELGRMSASRQDQSMQLDRNKKEVYRQMINHTEELENKVQALEFQVERKDSLIYDLQTQLRMTRNKPEQQSPIGRAEVENLRKEVESKDAMWAARLESRNSELDQAKDRLHTLQQELQQAKVQIIRKEAAESSANTQLNLSKAEVQRLKQSLCALTNTQSPKKKSEGHMDIQFHALSSQNDKLRSDNSKLLSTLLSKEAKINEIDSLKTQNNLIKQMLKCQKEKSIPKTSIAQAIKKVINIQPPKLKESLQVNILLLELYEELEQTRQEMLEQQLELKELRLYKNKLDHVLHQDEEGQNDFETTHIDAHFYRSRPNTDLVMKEELKKIAKKLDFQLQANIDANKTILFLKKRTKTLEDQEKNASAHLRAVVNPALTMPVRQSHLKSLLQWSGLEDLVEVFHTRLL